MREHNRNGSKLFLTELMIAIFFFSIITAVCVQLFADAHVMSKKSEELTQSVNIASNVAEYYMVWDGEQDSWDEVFPAGKWEQSSWSIAYDDQWQPCSEGDSYLAEMKLEKSGRLQTAFIVVKDNQGNELYSLEVKRQMGD